MIKKMVIFDAENPSEEELRAIDVHVLLPQQEPFVMIGTLVNKNILKKVIKLGFIGAVRNFEVIDLPHVGDVITTRVEVKEEVFGMTLAEASITCGDKVLVTSEIKIAVKEQEGA